MLKPAAGPKASSFVNICVCGWVGSWLTQSVVHSLGVGRSRQGRPAAAAVESVSSSACPVLQWWSESGRVQHMERCMSLQPQSMSLQMLYQSHSLSRTI